MAPGDRWFFDRVARVYDLLMPPARSAPLRAGLAMADGPLEIVLDVGGGTGRGARAVDAPQRVVVDLSGGMLARVPPPLAAVRGDARALPVADGAADAVTVVDAFHHLPDQATVVAEAYRVLRPGGVLVVRDFNRATLRGRALEAAEHAIRMRSTFRSAADLEALLDAAGFEAERLHEGFACTVVGRKPRRP